MKKAEIILGLIAIVAIVSRLFNLIDNSGIITSISLSILSIIYYVFAFALFNGIGFRQIFKKDSYIGTSNKRIAGGVVLGISLSILLTGINFKVNLLQGAETMLQIGIILTIIILLIYIKFYLKSRLVFYKRAFIRIIIIGGIGVIVYLTPSDSLVNIYYKDFPEYKEKYHQVLSDPRNNELMEELLQEKRKMDSVKYFSKEKKFN